MKAQSFEKVIPTCPVCGKGMPEGFITKLKKDAGVIDADKLYEAAFKYAKSLYKFADDKDIKESSQYEAFIAGAKLTHSIEYQKEPAESDIEKSLEEAAYNYAKKNIYRNHQTYDPDFSLFALYQEVFIAGAKLYNLNKKNHQKEWNSAMDFEDSEDDG